MLDKPILYPTAYRWVILFASLDVICTWIILALGGRELNVLARAVINAGGLPAMLAYKFAIIAFVLVLCEHIGRRQSDTGRRLANAAIVLNAFPVLVGMSHLGLNAASA
jgi:uncharacterized membrane protein